MRWVYAKNVSAGSHASEPDGLNRDAALACGCQVCYADTVEGSPDPVPVTINGTEFRVTRWIYDTPNVAQSEFEMHPWRGVSLCRYGGAGPDGANVMARKRNRSSVDADE